MYRLIFTIILLFSLITCGIGQSIPSYWMNIYSLEDYYSVRNREALKVDVQKTGYYSSGEVYKEKWVYNFLEPNKIQGELFMNGELKTKFTYVFDNLNRRIKNILETRYPLIGWKQETLVIEYVDGNKGFEKRYDSNDHLIRIAEFKYDSLNNPTQISFYKPNGHIESYERADYDYNNFNYQYRVFNADDSLVSQEFNYCNTYTLSNEENDFGDYVRVIWPTVSPEKKVYHEFSYKYDTHGNWTQREWTIVSNGEKKKRSIVKRKIDYKN